MSSRTFKTEKTGFSKSQVPHNPSSQSITIYPLMICATLTMLLDMIMTASLVSFATFGSATFGTAAIVWRHELNPFFNWLTRFNRRYKIATVLFTLVGALFLLDALSTPANAQFFQGAETWMTGQFTSAGEAIPLVFNVLRGLFLLYLGISLVKVIQAARQDEDWQNLARTPMIILIAITMGDILASLIVGGGGGGIAKG
ncbi:hypothetical protein H6G81_09525 [Scytonema hofmannii FACHB-248]|uniref:Uncharacterized protein n=1 Tax=Scytonema hofmannii FACHB-248 TaxID=1842502 RepID=A0ABR8GNY1_9CYAN|nr:MULTISPECIES: hypothetical protein [Nostocales]MBD2604760.1 hypothetical protein [Scytonema hofmannii FACHB-248]